MTTQHQIYTKKEKDMIKQDELLIEFIQLRNLSTNSIKRIHNVLLKYTRIQGLTPTQLIQEAEQEEETIPLLKHRTLKKRLNKFKITLQNEQYKNSTINTYINTIKTFYNHYEITLPQIQKAQVKNKETYKDIPTPEQIKKAINTAKNSKLKAIILFMASSGTAAQETCNITIQDFIEATKEYHHETRIEQVIIALEQRKDIIPTFQIIRQKTKTPYFTFCSPEATTYIIQYLRERLLYYGIKEDETLFKSTPNSLQQAFLRLNDECGFGWARDRCRFFHTHALRKFFGTRMFEEGVSELVIDFLEGRTISKVHQAYYKPNPENFKPRYINALNCVTIFSDVEYQDITSAEKEELELLRQRDKEREKQMRHIEQMIHEYKQLVE